MQSWAISEEYLWDQLKSKSLVLVLDWSFLGNLFICNFSSSWYGMKLSLRLACSSPKTLLICTAVFPLWRGKTLRLRLEHGWATGCGHSHPFPIPISHALPVLVPAEQLIFAGRNQPPYSLPALTSLQWKTFPYYPVSLWGQSCSTPLM